MPHFFASGGRPCMRRRGLPSGMVVQYERRIQTEESSWWGAYRLSAERYSPTMQSLEQEQWLSETPTGQDIHSGTVATCAIDFGPFKEAKWSFWRRVSRSPLPKRLLEYRGGRVSCAPETTASTSPPSSKSRPEHSRGGRDPSACAPFPINAGWS